METSTNFVDSFGIDLILLILTLLNDPADLVRTSAVSRSWRHFVVANGLCKKLWLRKVPFFTRSAYAVDKSDEIIIISEFAPEDAINWGTLVWEHKIYSSLLMPLAKPIIYPKECLAFRAICTDGGNILKARIPNDRGLIRISYWTCEGQSDPNVPENITYSLRSRICIVSEVCIKPFQAIWERRNPVYSPKSVRFRLGHENSLTNERMAVPPGELPSVDKFVWTYTSPEFPMKQVANSQRFKLPEPVVCVGGYFQVELLGRTQRKKSDGLFYVGLEYIKVLGHPLEPAYKLEKLESGELQFKFSPHALVLDLEELDKPWY